MKAPGLAIAALLLASAAPLQTSPAPARGLPAGWTMIGDAAYAPSDTRWRYSPPPPRRGTYAHGTSGDLPEAPEARAQAEQCYKRNGNFPAVMGVAEEYWYFESNGEGLLLLRTNELQGYDADCKPVIQTDFTVHRVLIGRNGFTGFAQSGDGWRAETRLFVEFRRPDKNDINIGNSWPAIERFAVRKRRLSDSDRGGKIGKVSTHCFHYSSPPDAGGSQCWIARGPGAGMVTQDYVIEMGSQRVNQNVTELEDDVPLDGRLFEWDRGIRGAGSAR